MCTLKYDNAEWQKHPPVARTLPTLTLQQLPIAKKRYKEPFNDMLFREWPTKRKSKRTSSHFFVWKICEFKLQLDQTHFKFEVPQLSLIARWPLFLANEFLCHESHGASVLTSSSICSAAPSLKCALKHRCTIMRYVMLCYAKRWRPWKTVDMQMRIHDYIRHASFVSWSQSSHALPTARKLRSTAQAT